MRITSPFIIAVHIGGKHEIQTKKLAKFGATNKTKIRTTLSSIWFFFFFCKL